MAPAVIVDAVQDNAASWSKATVTAKEIIEDVKTAGCGSEVDRTRAAQHAVACIATGGDTQQGTQVSPQYLGRQGQHVRPVPGYRAA